MTIDIVSQGALVQFRRTFTAVDGDPLTSVTATCALLDRAGGLHTVELDGGTVDGATVEFVGEYRIPEGNDTAGMWAERWETEGSLEGSALVYFYVGRDVVVAAEAAAP